MSDSVRPHRQQPTRLPRPWDSPDNNTGVGCHFLLQCTKMKRESEVAQSCPTLHNPMDCSLPGSSVHGIFLARGLEWGAIALSVNYHGILQKVNSQQLLISLNFSVSGLYFTDRLYAVLQSSEIKLLYYLDKIGCIWDCANWPWEIQTLVASML